MQERCCRLDDSDRSFTRMAGLAGAGASLQPSIHVGTQSAIGLETGNHTAVGSSLRAAVRPACRARTGRCRTSEGAPSYRMRQSQWSASALPSGRGDDRRLLTQVDGPVVGAKSEVKLRRGALLRRQRNVAIRSDMRLVAVKARPAGIPAGPHGRQGTGASFTSFSYFILAPGHQAAFGSRSSARVST